MVQELTALPKPLAGFEHISRHWDPTHQAYVAKILPGDYYVTVHDEIILTVLGSCISVCIRDAVFGIGGMNHFMLPSSSQDDSGVWQLGSMGVAARYGNHAMELLINAILAHGGSRKHLEAKVFGGGRILAQMTDVGQRNITFVRDYIRTEGLRLLAKDVGDICPRKVLYFPATGKVRMKKLRAMHNEALVQQETQYIRTLTQQRVESTVELF